MLKISSYNTPVSMIQKLGAGKAPGAPQKLTSGAPPKRVASQSNDVAPSFAAELSHATSGTREVQFSKHALARIHSRKLEMTPARLAELSRAMDKAERKGARETLILTDDAAFVVSPSSRTVISAFDRANLREGVFTSIDSAVIL